MVCIYITKDRYKQKGKDTMNIIVIEPFWVDDLDDEVLLVKKLDAFRQLLPRGERLFLIICEEITDEKKKSDKTPPHSKE